MILDCKHELDIRQQDHPEKNKGVAGEKSYFPVALKQEVMRTIETWKIIEKYTTH